MRVSLLNAIYSQPKTKNVNKNQDKKDFSPVYQYDLKADQVSFGKAVISEAKVEKVVSNGIELVQSKVNPKIVGNNTQPETVVSQVGERNKLAFWQMWDRAFEMSAKH